MKRAVFILLVLAGIVFQITADKQGVQDDTKRVDQPQNAGVQAEVSADGKTPAVKKADKNIGGNTPQPQNNESNQAKQKSSAGTLTAHSKSGDGINNPADTKVPTDMETKKQTTVQNTENNSAYYLSTAIESANRLAKEAEMRSQQALSELKQYSRDWDEQYKQMSGRIAYLQQMNIFIIPIWFVFLSMLVIVIIVCILFLKLRKKMSELEKSFCQQSSRFLEVDNQTKETLKRQRNSMDNELIQDRGCQDRCSQAAVKTAIDRKQTPIMQSPKIETIRPKNTGYAEQSNDNLSALYSSEAEREKWDSSLPTYYCLNVPESIRNRLFAKETLLLREIALTPSGNLNNALFILLNGKDVYLNFWLYNAERELPAKIEHIVRLVYDFDQPLPRCVKGCRPALVRKTNDGYTMQQKGKIVLV